MRQECSGSVCGGSRSFFEDADAIERKEDPKIGEGAGVVRAVDMDLRDPNESQDEAKDELLVEAMLSIGTDADVADLNEEEDAAMHALHESLLAGRLGRMASHRP